MMKKQSEKTYWEELKEKKIKVSIKTKEKRFYSGYVKDYNKEGIIFIDKFGDEVFLSFDSVSFAVPFKENGGENGRV